MPFLSGAWFRFRGGTWRSIFHGLAGRLGLGRVVCGGPVMCTPALQVPSHGFVFFFRRSPPRWGPMHGRAIEKGGASAGAELIPGRHCTAWRGAGDWAAKRQGGATWESPSRPRRPTHASGHQNQTAPCAFGGGPAGARSNAGDAAIERGGGSATLERTGPWVDRVGAMHRLCPGAAAAF